MRRQDRTELRDLLGALKHVVFEDWVTRARNEVRHAAKLTTPALIDTLPVFYDQLIELLCNRGDENSRSNLAEEHGGERARMTAYPAEDVVHELQLFRTALLEVWRSHQVAVELSDVIEVNQQIDRAIRESVTGYMAAETAFRERFFATLTHDMRTPLNTASMALEMIRNSDSLDRVQRLATVAANQHELLERMLTDLLDTVALAGEREALVLTPVSLRTLVGGVVESMRLSTGRQIVCEDGPPILGKWSPEAIRRALENLVSNAVKYSSPGTTIVIVLDEFGGRAIVQVINEGVEIPLAQQEKIFQLFRRSSTALHGPAPGWGIGLPYVRSVAERHGGTISVRCENDKVRFVLDIPLDPQAVLAPAY